MTDRSAPAPVRRLLAVVSLLIAAATLVACGPSAPTAPPGAVPVTFIYAIVGPAAGATHTTHFQLLDAQNKLLTETLMQPAGNVDTVTISLPPGIYSAISWDEEPASPDPAISRKCGSVFTVDPGLALVVTITSSRAGACLTDTAEPGASPSPPDSAAPGPS
ncbi:MAG: hypothetical protein ACRDGI_04360 [Candidatus Limnocylindrales bacterium]